VSLTLKWQKDMPVISAIYFLSSLYFIAAILVLSLPVLIDYGFSLLLLIIFMPIYLFLSKDNPFKFFFGYGAWFFLCLAWVSGVVLWEIDHRLDQNLEGKELYVEGQVIGLPKQSSQRQTFEFVPARFFQCEVLNPISNCHSLDDTVTIFRPIPKRWLSMQWSDVLWVYFFRTEKNSALPKKISVALYKNNYQKKYKNNIEKPLRQVRGGEYYQLLLKMRRPRSTLNFFGFDYETWLFAQGIHAKAYVRSKGENKKIIFDRKLEKENSAFSISGFRESIREKLLAHPILSLASLFESQNYNIQESRSPSHVFQNNVSQSKALLLALTIGDRSFISERNKELLINTGVAHLLAISGMHIGFLSVLIFFLAYNFARISNWSIATISSERLSLFILPTQFAAVVSFCAAAAYAGIAGFSLPTQRALLVVLVYSVGIIFFKQVGFYKLWCFAILLVLIRDPLALLGSGFYLSFAAVFFIQWIMLGRFSVSKNLRFEKTKIALKVQLAVFIGLAPLLLLFFSAFYPLALVCNLFAVPLVSVLVLPLGLLSILLIPLSNITSENPSSVSFNPISNIISGMVSEVVSILLYLAETFLDILLIVLSRFEILLASDMYFSLNIATVVILSVFLLLLMSPILFRLKLLLASFCIPVFLYGINEGIDQKVLDGEVRFQMLDVGQGLALIVETRNHLLVYDTGPAFGENFNAGEAIVIPALRNLSVANSLWSKPLNILMLSHGDNDHVGGAQAILNNYPVEEILAFRQSFYPKRKIPIEHKVKWKNCEEGQSWQWDGVNFELFYPLEKQDMNIRKSNNLSCVLRIQTRSASLLLTGDIESKAEKKLIQSLNSDGQVHRLKSNILISAHHGSNSSSTMSFLQAVVPDLVLISSGFNNRFGHPHEKVIRRYRNIGAENLNTANTGALIFESWRYDSDHPSKAISKARQIRHRFWRF
jgi:competence protein ComEC